MTFLVEAGVVGQGAHFKIAAADGLRHGQRNPRAKHFLRHHGGSTGEIDEVDRFSQHLGEVTRRLEAYERPDRNRREKGEINVAGGMLGRRSKGAEQVDHRRLERRERGDDLLLAGTGNPVVHGSHKRSRGESRGARSEGAGSGEDLRAET